MLSALLEVQQEPVHPAVAEVKQGQFGGRKLKTYGKTCRRSVEESQRLAPCLGCSPGAGAGWEPARLRYLQVTQMARLATGRWLWVAGSPVTRLLLPAGESEPAAPACACLGMLRLCCRRSCEPAHPRRRSLAALGVSNRIAFPFLLFVFISRT